MMGEKEEAKKLLCRLAKATPCQHAAQQTTLCFEHKHTLKVRYL